jgi:hypothetical protein
MNGKRAAIVAIGAELIMAASIGLSGVIGLHGHASASPVNSAPVVQDGGDYGLAPIHN